MAGTIDCCPKCGCESYIYKQLERSFYNGDFGEKPDKADTEIVRTNKMVECFNCGYRIPREDAFGPTNPNAKHNQPWHTD